MRKQNVIFKILTCTVDSLMFLYGSLSIKVTFSFSAVYDTQETLIIIIPHYVYLL